MQYSSHKNKAFMISLPCFAPLHNYLDINCKKRQKEDTSTQRCERYFQKYPSLLSLLPSLSLTQADMHKQTLFLRGAWLLCRRKLDSMEFWTKIVIKNTYNFIYSPCRFGCVNRCIQMSISDGQFLLDSALSTGNNSFLVEIIHHLHCVIQN